MANKKFDSIFEPTAEDKAEGIAKPRRNGAKAKTVENKDDVKKLKNGADNFIADQFAVLKVLLMDHEGEALYRKGKEDKLLIAGIFLGLVVAIGGMIVLAMDVSMHWFWRFIFRLFFAGSAALVCFAASALIELNRKRLQDVLSTVVRIQEKFGLFDDGAFSGSDGSFLPNTYKFIGSQSDDETNYAQLILKVTAFAGAVAILIFP